MSEWLELELAHHLSPAPAPDALWDRVQPPGRNCRPTARRGLPRALPVAAILTLMAAAGALWLVARGQEPAVNLVRLAADQAQTPARLEFRSSDPSEIARWIYQEGGVRVSLEGAAPSVRLAGARIIRVAGMRIGAVIYQVGGDPATLLVARAAEPGDSRHGGYSWRSGSQAYAIACPGHPEAACLLCHTSL